MQTKLTLRLDNVLIEKAKAWAKDRRISLSQAVTEIFAQLAEKKAPKPSASLSPWTRRLIGAAAGQRKVPTDDKVRHDYLDYLDAKHQ